MNNTIPIMHCFDNNYVIPAGIAFYSMLENSNKSTKYILYVLHTDITNENQQKLCDTISCFENAEIVFTNMDNKFNDEFIKLKNKAHFSKEMFYKLITPSLFPQYDKIIISDVDVVYLGNFEEQFFEFDINTDIYLSGFRGPIKKGSWVENYMINYKNHFDNDEFEKLYQGVGAGFLIFNLKKMREQEIEDKFIQCVITNTERIIQPEQDVLNLVCFPKIKILEKNTVVCTYLYDLYVKDDDFLEDIILSEQDLRFIMANPIQLHYAGTLKPWINPGCTKSEHWYQYLLKTPFFYEQMDKLGIQYSPPQLFDSLSLRKKIKLTFNHIAKKYLSK